MLGDRPTHKPRIRPRANTKRYFGGWVKVQRRAYEWQSVKVWLPFLRDLVVWERKR